MHSSPEAQKKHLVFRSPQADRTLLWSLLGDLPDRHRPSTARLIKSEDQGEYHLETLELDLNGFEPIPAYLVLPKALVSPTAAILYHHAHCGAYEVGKEEFVRGRALLQSPPYAVEIARRGWVGLCIDAWCFGGRRGRTESETFKEMLWNGQVLWGMMVYDAVRALDYLVSRPEVDATRIATLGLSMGSTMAWWLAALDERIRLCVDLCCLTDFEALLQNNHLDRHGLYYYVPGLLKHFSTARINALIAPRAHLSLAGTRDALTPVDGLDRIDTHLRRVYAERGAAEAWHLHRSPGGHEETPAMRREILLWLTRWLGNPAGAVAKNPHDSGAGH